MDSKTGAEVRQQVTARFLSVIPMLIARGDIPNKKQFIERIGQKAQNLYMMEQGSRSPTLGQVYNACILFNINPEWLLMGTGPIFTLQNAETIPNPISANIHIRHTSQPIPTTIQDTHKPVTLSYTLNKISQPIPTPRKNKKAL